MNHSLEECPQNPTIGRIEDTLSRLDAHGERTAVALETIAAQGILVSQHEKRLDKHDEHFNELFTRVRKVELKDAKDLGAKTVENKSNRFWDQIKTNLVPYVIGSVFLFFYTMDKYDVFQKIAKIYKEMKG